MEPLADHPDPALAVRAQTALYLADPAQRDELLPDLVNLTNFDGRNDLYRETVIAMYYADPERRDTVVRQVVASLAPQYMEDPFNDPLMSWIDPGIFLADLGKDLIPHLDASFRQATPVERLYVLATLHGIMLRDAQVDWSSVGTVASTIPPAAKPLIERAKADPDVRVRKWAELIGQPQGGMGSGMGTGGGFF